MRARILFVPIFAAFEARPFAQQAAEWAEVESFDSPGTGARRDEEPGSVEDVAAAGSERLDQLGWERAVVVCDSHAQGAGIELALRDPRVAGIGISHAAVRYSTEGERAPLNPAVYAAAAQLLDSDLRSFGRALTQLTQGKFDEEWVDDFLATVPRRTAQVRASQLDGHELVARLTGTELEVVLGCHVGCLMWSREGFDDAVAAVPGAVPVECESVPLSDEGFVVAMRELCASALG
jgi:hypothetical protein